MVESDKEKDKGFSSRWSRRKREMQVKEEDKTQASGESIEESARAGEVAVRAPEEDSAETAPPEVPDPDTLELEADFSVFLQDGVPEAIRRRALRRLWRLNPVFANLDGLNDYDDDFTDAASVVEGLKTLYKVGKGFITEEDEKKAEEAASGDVAAVNDQDAVAGASDADDEFGEAELESDSPDNEPQNPGMQTIPPPEPIEVTHIEVSGPGNRRRGALARRWGKMGG